MKISKALGENESRELDDESMSTLSENDQIDNENDSEDDEAFLARFDKDGNSIG